MPDLVNLYSERKINSQDQLNRVQQRVNKIVWMRVAMVLTMIILFYFGYNLLWVWAILLGLVVSYGYLVSVHEKLNYQKKFLGNLVTINNTEILAQQGDNSFFNDGEAYIDNKHPYAVDLDIFGRGSIFQRFNRTCTDPGKDLLAAMLSQPLSSEQDIQARQEAVRELSEKLDFRQNFQATGMTSPEKKEDQKKLLEWLTHEHLLYGKQWYKVIMIVLPILSLLALLYWIFQGIYIPFAFMFLIQWTIIGSHAKQVTLFQNYIGDKRYILEKFAAHFRLLDQEKFSSLTLQSLTARSHEAYTQLNVLASRSRALDLRLNFIANLILNTTVLYDLQCVLRLEKWREENKHNLAAWLKAVQEADALNSYATFYFNHPHFVFPAVRQHTDLIMENAGHPLIAPQASVTNHVSMTGDATVWIVTGANMAGKSTFLRTVGVNVVLALTGSAVCATRMSCPLLQIHTGMRNTDSINDNQSYFFAELLRLQRIIEELKQGTPLLILLDEILKGTNSGDKLTGSQELVHQLVQYPCKALVATHDIALAEMEKDYPEKVFNFHFETFIKGDNLSFDYKLKSGVSTGKNATFLMKKMGIIG